MSSYLCGLRKFLVLFQFICGAIAFHSNPFISMIALCLDYNTYKRRRSGPLAFKYVWQRQHPN